jgi:eukaryotic-like serine/threonine-protein kinase
MKNCLITALFVLIPTLLTGQTLQPGTWEGQLNYQNQNTTLYIDIRETDQELSGYLYLPVTNFFENSLGEVVRSDSGYTAGPLFFTFQEDHLKLEGYFHSSARDLTFELQPVNSPPEYSTALRSEPVAVSNWTFQAEGAIWGGMTAHNDTLFFGSEDGLVYALEIETGKELWRFKTGGALFSKPYIYENKLFITSDDGYLYMLSLKDGSKSGMFDLKFSDWKRKLPHHAEPGYDTMGGSVTSGNHLLYAGSPGGYILAIDPEHKTEVWRFETSGPVLSAPVYNEGVLYAGSMDHYIYALDAATGELLWSFDTGQAVISTPAVSGGRVLIGSRSADLFALDALTGTPEWNYFYWFSWVESSGVFFDQTFYIGSSDSQLLKAFQPESGKLLWSARVDGSPWSTPAVSHERVYIGVFGNTNYFINHKGGFAAFDRLTGEEAWRYEMEPADGTSIYGVVSSPVISQNQVLFGSLDGMVYAFPK